MVALRAGCQGRGFPLIIGSGLPGGGVCATLFVCLPSAVVFRDRVACSRLVVYLPTALALLASGCLRGACWSVLLWRWPFLDLLLVY